ncbi:hypothetical protein [uncultured Vibrio sp.]|uniref:hypothetical protein n=1 Tax=uncultured Vibrio sp. TaxID=114054 RepID=UPI0025F654C8|nr:hypothetical protein [uncultured Vibrio sp.]
MKQAKKINTYMFNLLIKREMNNFTVTEARDCLMKDFEEFDDLHHARKTIYRQILTFVRRGWLKHTGKGHTKRYQKSEQFLQLSFESNNDLIVRSTAEQKVKVSTNSSFGVLVAEKNRYEGELAIILGEVDEFQSLLKRFPNEEELLYPMFVDAKDRSAKLLGRINTLSKVLITSELEVAA